MKGLVARVCLAALALSLLLPTTAAAQQPLPAQPAPPPERPATLAQVLTTALQNNLALRIAAFETQIARAQLAAARAAKSGTGSANVSVTQQNAGPGTTIVIPPGIVCVPSPPTCNTAPIIVTLPPAPSTLYGGNLTLEYPLYTGGRLEAQIALAAAAVRGAEATLERTKQEIILQAKLAYYGVLVAQAGVEVAQRTVAQAEETLRIAQARVRAGTSPRFDEIQAEVSVANARQGLVRARNGVAVATQGLAAVMGLPIDTPVRPQEAMGVLPVTAPAAELVARGLKERPELVEHQALVDAAKASIELARAGMRPVVGVVGSISGGASSYGGSVTLTWSVMLAATIPLFDGGVTAARVREAELRLEQLQTVEAQLRQRIELEVRQAALNLSAAGEELATAGATIESAREALRIAQVRFREGVGTNLEVIAAQAALAQAEAARVQALFAFNQARAQLERAVGGAVP